MANRTEHISAAVPVGIAFSFYNAHEGNRPGILWEVLGGALGAIIGALLPDLIDVPDYPNHRGVAHGFATVGGLAYGASKYLDDIQNRMRIEARPTCSEQIGCAGTVAGAVARHFRDILTNPCWCSSRLRGGLCFSNCSRLQNSPINPLGSLTLNWTWR
jgi:hypothetical protein